MRLIDADKLKNSYGWWEGNDRQLTRDEVRHYFDAMIDAQATVEVEIKHGKWIYDDEAYPGGNPYGHYDCDQCGESVPHKTNYCPNCGAKMDEVGLTTSAEMHPEKYLKNLNEVERMRVVDIIEMLEAQIEQLKEKYCNECQEWSCENCWARIDLNEVEE